MKSKLLLSILSLAVAQSALAATVIFEETFDDATTNATIAWGPGAPGNGTTITGDNTWTTTGHSGVTGETRVGDDEGNAYGWVRSTYPGGGSGWRATQTQTQGIIPGSLLNDYALSDIKFSVKLQVQSSVWITGSPVVGIQIRQSGHGLAQDRTHTVNWTATFSEDWYTFEFTLNQGVQSLNNVPFAGFNDSGVRILFEMADSWGVAGEPNIVNLFIDDIRVTAIPEPSAALLGFAAIPLLLRRRRVR